ncbi:hypothetical protein [Floridanema evergladense]|uniref:Uncharacterized protein n=1 Tax=Floridaenema evergladense BLCC-F167 TaxID=3153639 RepID=A0ABV4WUR9_9CYAN
MNEQSRIPDEQTRKRNIELLRESQRQLDLFGIKLDELIAITEAEIRRQKLERLQEKYKRSAN